MEIIFAVILAALLFPSGANAQIVAPQGIDVGAAKANFVCRSDTSCSNVTASQFSVGGSALVVKNGMVGIGTTAPDPAAKLNVAGNISLTGQVISSGTSQNYFAGQVGVGIATAAFGGTQKGFAAMSGTVVSVLAAESGSSKGFMGTASAHDFALHAGGSEKARVTATQGSVLVGTTTEKLGGTQKGFVAVSGTNELYLNAESGNSRVNLGTNAGSAISVNIGTNRALVINSAGNVGIGTTAPSTKVDIASGTITMAGTGAPAAGKALCLNATTKAMGVCTDTPAADGSCTCN